ncbi:beclin 1-associated autophagy-related key regulator isoform X2 [Bacillus rossius redtenbacheri]
MLIKERKQQLAKRKPLAVRIQLENKKRLDRLPCYRSLVEEKAARVRQMRHERVANKLRLDNVQDELKTLIRWNVQQLVSHIFPISVVEPVQPPADRGRDTVSALADASRTAYVRGHWVLTDSSGELHHCIVAPTLPGSGDYSAYSIWHAANKDTGMSGVDSVDCNPAFNIAAGLTFATQLVNVLAFYTGVRLPHKLSYADFCGHEMGEQTFVRRVAKLNRNVLHLCFSQSARPEQLQPTRTLHNVLVLLDTSACDLGRQGPLEVDPQEARLLEEQLSCDLDLSEDSGSESDDNFPQEWEAVPNVSCPEVNAGAVASVPSQQLASAQQSTSMMSSALNTITSLWRGWAAHR